MKNVDVLINNVRQWSALPACLDAIHSQTARPRWVSVLDDYDGDESEQKLNLIGQKRQLVPIRLLPGKSVNEKLKLGYAEALGRCTQIGQPAPNLIIATDAGNVLAQDFIERALVLHAAEPRVVWAPEKAPGLCLVVSTANGEINWRKPYRLRYSPDLKLI